MPKKQNLLKDLWKPRIHSLGIGCWIRFLITSDMPFKLTVLVKLTSALITSKSPYLLMHRLNMLFEIRWDWCLVSAQMTNFKITFLSMNILLILGYSVFYCMSVIAFITFIRFLACVGSLVGGDAARPRQGSAPDHRRRGRRAVGAHVPIQERGARARSTRRLARARWRATREKP